MTRLGSLFLIAFLFAAGRADAVSAKDIIDLRRAGLGEAVLLALVEVDGGVFTIDNATLRELKAAGVTAVVFDRNGFIYHGRIKEVADGAREAGLEF